MKKPLFALIAAALCVLGGPLLADATPATGYGLSAAIVAHSEAVEGVTVDARDTVAESHAENREPAAGGIVMERSRRPGIGAGSGGISVTVSERYLDASPTAARVHRVDKRTA